MSVEEKITTRQPNTLPAVVEPVMTQEMLYYMYQDQLRRFIDAKIDIMKSSIDTQNKILLMQAKATIETGFTPMVEQYQLAREEAAKYLDYIDHQIEDLPGATKDQKDRLILAHMYE